MHTSIYLESFPPYLSSSGNLYGSLCLQLSMSESLRV